MRILLLCHRYLDTQIGGMAEFLHHLPKTLKNQGIECIIYTQSENDSNQVQGPITLPNGIDCYTGPYIKPSWFSSIKKLNPLLTLCKDQKIDLIHAQGIYRSGYMAMKASQKLRIPYIVTSHSDILTAGSDRMKRGKVQSRCATILKNANGVTHLTPMMANAAHAIYDTRDKSTVIGNGIDLHAWNAHINSIEKNYIVAIGRLEREKGFHVLIDAFASLKQRGSKSSFIIAGSGSEEKNLQMQAKNLGINVLTQFTLDNDIPEQSLIFTGYINGEMKMRLIAESQLVLFAPQPDIWEEPFGIVQIEAMAAGKSLIASDTAATRYLQQAGLQAQTVKANDINAWANKIFALSNNNELRKKTGIINLENSKQYDWPIIAKQYTETYKHILDSRNH